MVYGTPSDPLLRFALYSGSIVFLLTLALLASIAILRFVIDRRDRRERELTARWHPVFFHAIEGLPYTVPRIFGRDREVVLLVWIHFTESIRGEARLRLQRLALDIKLDRTALKLLARRNLRARLLGVVALGRLGVLDAWQALATLAADPNAVVSLLAARSLLQIDAVRALPVLFESLPRRADWPVAKVAAMLDDVPADLCTRALADAFTRATPTQAARLLGLLETTHTGDTWPMLAPLLDEKQPTDVLAAALKACRDPRGLAAARALAAHPLWFVRAQAAGALGRLGTHEDGPLLQTMLGDPEWWVRYRAALALVALPGTSRDNLLRLCERLTDRFAIDILKQALAETSIGVAP